jgi:tetratricopeptide (TPR) repeat protein
MSNFLKGVRYYKRIKLGKFLALNISKTGIGLSVGIRGLRYSRGPSGSHLTVGLPGTGLRYQRKVSTQKGLQFASLKKLLPGSEPAALPARSRRASAQAVSEPETPELPKPGLFAPGWEKNLYKGINAFLAEDIPAAIDYLREAVEEEDVDLGAAILLAYLLSGSDDPQDGAEAIGLLERVVSTDEPFPTPIIEQYMIDIGLTIAITPQIEVLLPLSEALAAALLLVELYQAADELEAAIGLLEDLDELIAAGNNQQHDQVLTLSLAELYLVTKNYQGIITQVQVPETISDDILLGLSFFYARALQEQNLHQAAVKVFNKCLRRKKGLNADLRQACRLWRAMSYLKQDQKKRARAELERVLAEAQSDEIKRAALQALRIFWPDNAQADDALPPAKLNRGK